MSNRDNHNREYLARIEAERIMRAAAIQQPQQQQIPVANLFIQSYYGILQTLMAQPEMLPDDAVNLAWDAAERAFRKLGFQIVVGNGQLGAQAITEVMP